jgi:excisionase family DNA binding protein
VSTPHNVLPFTARPDDSAPADPAEIRVTSTRAVYTVSEVAELLDLSLGGTYQLCRNGEIPAIKLGNRWVIPKRRFHDWLDNPGDQEVTN